MTLHSLVRAIMAGSLATTLAACGGGIGSNPFGSRQTTGIPTQEQYESQLAADRQRANLAAASQNEEGDGSTIWDLFSNSDDPNTTVEVNKYLWNAALDVLNFLPITSIDPFTGVIVTGYGTPPGGGRAYRATIYVQDPALDARSLKVALQTSGGRPASAETARAVEDAILTRARQLRVQDSRL